MASFGVGGVAAGSAAAKIQAVVFCRINYRQRFDLVHVISESLEVIIFGVSTFDKALSHSFNQLVFSEYL